jgi:hypothetical protein
MISEILESTYVTSPKDNPPRVQFGDVQVQGVLHGRALRLDNYVDDPRCTRCNGAKTMAAMLWLQR